MTRHGKDDLVIMSLDHYQSLAEPPKALYAHEAPERVLDLMRTQTMDDEHAQFDDEVEPDRD